MGSGMDSCWTDTFECTDFSHSWFMARKAENWKRIAKLTFLDICNVTKLAFVHTDT